jgi:peroxiredoxin
LAGLRSFLKKNEKVNLYAISVDPPERGREFAKKIASDGKGEVGFSLLSDPEHRTIDAYGLVDPAYQGQKIYGIPYAAVYVIDKQGRVVWTKIESDYKQRPTNNEIRAALSALK